MGGGLMQIRHLGINVPYLTGNPQITLFKVVYRRHSNFSMESIQQTFHNDIGFDKTITSTISRNGDLVSRMYVEINPKTIIGNGKGTWSGNDSTQICSYFGNCLLKEVKFEIGGQIIDKLYREWLSVYADLTESNKSQSGGSLINDAEKIRYTVYPERLRQVPHNWQKMSFNVRGFGHPIYEKYESTTSMDIHNAQIPLPFWFCRNPGLALPIIALQNHEVKLTITTATREECINPISSSSLLNSENFKLWIDYIYLDTDERRRFAQVSHEYLIEQVQRNTFPENKKKFELNFSHPVKELIWGLSPKPLNNGPNTPHTESQSILSKDYDSGFNVHDSENTIQINFNNNIRVQPRHPNYFTNCQVWQNHTGCGGAVNPDSIFIYSFALKPEEHQPSGFCNFSKINKVELITKNTVEYPVTVFAVNYNLLRIMSGMGGLAYST